MKRNWRAIDKLALVALEYILNYCDVKDICSDCIFHDPDTRECSIHVSDLSQFEKRMKEGEAE